MLNQNLACWAFPIFKVWKRLEKIKTFELNGAATHLPELPIWLSIHTIVHYVFCMWFSLNCLFQYSFPIHVFPACFVMQFPSPRGAFSRC